MERETTNVKRSPGGASGTENRLRLSGRYLLLPFFLILAAGALYAQIPVKVSFTVSPSSPVYQQDAVFTVTVASTIGTPAGSAYIADLVNGRLNSPVTLSNGSAVIHTSSLAQGAHFLAACFLGSGSYENNCTPDQLIWVVDGSTETSLTASSSMIAAGDTVTFNAAVSTQGAPGAVGNVTFYDGGAALGTVPVTDVAVTNVIPYSSGWTDPWGYFGSMWGEEPQVTANAVSAPDGTMDGTELSFPTVPTLGSEVMGSYGVNTWSFGADISGLPVTFSTWLRADSPVTVWLYLANDLVWTISAPGTPAAQACAVTQVWQRCAVSYISPADSGDDTFDIAVAIRGQQPPQSFYVWGGQLEMGASPGPYAPNPAQPYWVWDFGIPYTGTGGTASFSTAALSVGTHTITAVYDGQGTLNGSASPPLTVVVSPTGVITATDLFVSPATAALGSPVTLSATVDSFPITPADAYLSGSVSFYDCGALVATVPVAPAGNTNLIPSSDNLAQGWTGESSAKVDLPGTIETVLVPDPRGSTTASQFDGGAFYQEISGLPGNASEFTFSFWMRTLSGLASPTIQAEGNDLASPLVTSAWIRYAATFAAPSSGSVKLRVANIKQVVQVWGLQLEAASSAGPYVSTSSGAMTAPGGSAVYTTTSFAQGQHALTAEFNGSGNPSMSGTVWLWVGAPPATSVTSSPNPSTVSGSVTFSVVATQGNNGSIVMLWDGTNAIGTVEISANKGSFSTSSLAVGMHTITASCCGAGTQLSAASSVSPPLTQVVDPPGASGAPSAPSILGVTSSGSGTTATVAWTPAANAAVYYLYRCPGAGCAGNFQTVGNALPADATSFTDTGLAPYAAYGYSVSAYNSYGYSANSSVAYLMPSIPQTIHMYPGSFSDSGGAASGNTCTGQDVPMPFSAGGAIDPYNSVEPMSSSWQWFEDEYGVGGGPGAAGTKYGVLWQGWAAAGARNFSSLQLVAEEFCQGHCEWDYSPNNGASWQLGAATAGEQDDTAITFALPASQDLTQLQVRYCGSAVNSTDAAAVEDVHVEGICTNCLPALYNLAAIPADDGQSVSLTYVDDTASNYPQYYLYSAAPKVLQYCTGANCAMPIDNFYGLDPLQTTFGSTPSTVYGFQVCATTPPVDTCSLSAYVTTPAGPPPPPAWISLAPGANGVSMALAWSDSDDLRPITSYSVERCFGELCEYGFAVVATLGANASTFSDSGLLPGNAYGYRVRALNSAGYSPYSAIAYATTPVTMAITGVMPSSGWSGAVVTLTGLMFGAQNSQSSVTFNGAGAQIMTWADQSIVILIPSGAATGPGSIVVSTASGQSNAASFTVLGTSSGAPACPAN